MGNILLRKERLTQYIFTQSANKNRAACRSPAGKAAVFGMETACAFGIVSWSRPSQVQRLYRLHGTRGFQFEVLPAVTGEPAVAPRSPDWHVVLFTAPRQSRHRRPVRWLRSSR